MIVNGKFAEVPADFKVQDITDTVISDIGITICSDAGMHTNYVQFTQTGNVSLNGLPVAAGERVIVPGTDASVEVNQILCSLDADGSTLCDWQNASHPQPAQYAPLMFDTWIHTPDFDLNIVRNFVVPTYMDHPLKTVQKSINTNSERSEIEGHSTLMQRMLVSEDLQFGFLKMEVKTHHNDVQLHGLLGHRAVNADAVEPSVVKATSVTGDITVGGHQGEGVIEGHYTDYKMANQDLRAQDFKFSTFTCQAASA